MGTIPCRIHMSDASDTALEGTEVRCITSAAPVAPWIADQLSISLDNANRTLRTKFSYLPDPVIELIEPLAAFASGGRMLRVSGKNLNVTQKAQMYLIDPIKLRHRQQQDSTGESIPQEDLGKSAYEVLDEDLPPLASNFGECSIQSDEVMFCKSPRLLPVFGGTSARLVRRRQKRRSPSARAIRMQPVEDYSTPEDIGQYPKWPIGFRMDAVGQIRNLGKYYQLTVTPDPEFEAFPLNGRRYFSGRDIEHDISDKDDNVIGQSSQRMIQKPRPTAPLLLFGKRLNLAADIDEVTVWIGEHGFCNVTGLSQTHVSCVPQPPIQSDTVIVTIGQLQFSLGKLKVFHGNEEDFVDQVGLFLYSPLIAK